jgi:MFS family permease
LARGLQSYHSTRRYKGTKGRRLFVLLLACSFVQRFSVLGSWFSVLGSWFSVLIMHIRNLTILGLAQAFGNAGLTLVILLGGLIGAASTPNPSLATLPTAAHILGIACTAMPAAFSMQRFGRKRGFLGAAILATFAAILACDAIIQHNISQICIAFFLLGANGAFVQQYRFAASENAPANMRGRAVSFVLIGGIASGVLGPLLAQHGTRFINASAYAGAFLALALCYMLAALLLSFLQEQTDRSMQGEDSRPLYVIARQPRWQVAMLAGTIGYAIMGLLMAATPLAMIQLNGLTLPDAAWVIQSHFIAMFAPSLVTGFLIDRFGTQRMLIAGIICLSICMIISMFSQHVLHYWWAMLLLGVGWNLLFVSGTVLLGQTHRPAERFKVQAINDCIMFSVQACAALLAGSLLFTTNWIILNLVSIPLLLGLGVALMVFHRQQQLQRA